MSTDNKTKASTSCPPKKKCRYSTETMSKIKLRRRDLYKQLPVDKKESLLLQRRLKELESKKQHVLMDYTEEESLFQVGANLRRQRTLTINEPSSVGNKVDISAFDGAAIDSNKEKNVTGYLSVFELGSTSGVPYEGHDAELSAVKNKAANVEAHVPKLRGNLKKGKSICDAPTIRETVDPLPSYGRGRERPGGRYMSLLHGDGLHDMIITGENDSIDGHGDVWWKYRCIYVIKRGNITMTQAGNKSYTKRQSTVVGWVLLWSFDDCLMDVNVFVSCDD